MSNGLVFDIQRFSIHDGDGIRTTIFFKGCSLDCSWCQNPESKNIRPQLLFDKSKCDNCKLCLSACSEQAIQELSKEIVVDFTKCTNCFECVPVCPTDAFKEVGHHYTVGQLVEKCLEDKDFYDQSNGGITLSGGEAVLQSKFLQEFLPQIQSKGINILLETAGNYPFNLLEPLLPYIDHIYFDLKCFSEKKHIELTGAKNKLILENLKELARRKHSLTVRVVNIESNNTVEEIQNISSFLLNLKINNIVLLKYNGLWESKLPKINTKQTTFSISTGSSSIIDSAKQYQQFGIQTNIME